MFATVRFRFLTLTLFVIAAASPALAQTQYQIGNPTNEQQYMLELINRARANADAEAVRLGIGSRQEGPPRISGQVWQIPNTTQPLSWNPELFNAAQTTRRIYTKRQFFWEFATLLGQRPNSRMTTAGSLARIMAYQHRLFPTESGERQLGAVRTRAKLIAKSSCSQRLFTDRRSPRDIQHDNARVWREIGSAQVGNVSVRSGVHDQNWNRFPRQLGTEPSTVRDGWFTMRERERLL